MAEEPTLAFIPKLQFYAGKAFHKAKFFRFGQSWIVAQHFRQPIEWNPGVQVVDMVDTDIAGQPAQHAGQHIMRTAV